MKTYSYTDLFRNTKTKLNPLNQIVMHKYIRNKIQPFTNQTKQNHKQYNIIIKTKNNK